MANNLNTNPVFLDTFTADVTIATGPIKIKEIVIQDTTAGDTATFIDSNDVECARVSVDIGGSIGRITPNSWFTRGVVFDASASSIASGGYCYIYKE